MIELIDTLVTAPELGSRIITWEVKSTSEDINDYCIDIYRAEASGSISEFNLIDSGINPQDGTYLDENLGRLDFSKNREIYYYLKVYLSSAPSTYYDYGPYTMITTPDLTTLEIIRRKNLILNNPRYGARTFNVLKRRTWGNYCTTCVDPVTQRVQDVNCPDCYGTGIEGGYFNSMDIKGYRSDKNFRVQLNIFGKFEDNEVSFVFGNSPILLPNDYIVDEQNVRYKILPPVRHVEKGMYVISQMVRAEIVPKSDSIYLVSV